jgi:hypothetical protein
VCNMIVDLSNSNRGTTYRNPAQDMAAYPRCSVPTKWGPCVNVCERG